MREERERLTTAVQKSDDLQAKTASEPAGSGADAPELYARWKEREQFKARVTGVREDSPSLPPAALDVDGCRISPKFRFNII